MSNVRKLRDAAIVVAAVIVPFLFLSAHLKHPNSHNAVDDILTQLTTPLRTLARDAALGTSTFLQDYVLLTETSVDNERLRLENARLFAESERAIQTARENKRLRALLELREALRRNTIGATVIAKDSSPYFRVASIAIDAGERRNVKEGMPVVAHEGLVGRIDRVHKTHADVLLTVDRKSSVEIIVPRTGARGALQGMSSVDSYACRLQRLQETDEVRVGDRVYTSGYGKHFPGSILVGHVESIQQRKDTLEQVVTVRPSVNFSGLEHVLVVTDGPNAKGATK